MKIILAGYNLDSTVIEELKRSGPPRDDVTPETLSAAYARISRDPRSADVLRAAAREEVERARRSNRTIIFSMGHHSVAEHAVFNFDVIGVSRLAMEEIERFRLCSYTEKSQRYIKLQDDHVVPEEVIQAGKREPFTALIKSQNALYRRLLERLRPYFFESFPELAADPKRHAVLNGWAKEDARYAMSLATLGQLGMTLNARNLEHMIRRFASHPLAEIRSFNRRLYELARQVAPSIVLFTEASDFDRKTYLALREAAADVMSDEEQGNTEDERDPMGEEKCKTEGAAGKSDAVRLVGHTPEPDERLIAALLHTSSKSPYATCLVKARSLSRKRKMALVQTALRHMEFYDAALREFEHADLTFELVVSASCFAQLKRHRMATLTAQLYHPSRGVVVPPSVEAVGARRELMDILERSEDTYFDLNASLPHGAEYALTNAHCKRVLWKANAREFYHFSRLREDATAQWDIRRMAAEMRCRAVEVMPLTMLLIGGKDAYPEVYAAVYGSPPKLKPPSA